MFFCEKCRYTYNITKDIRTRQIGGKVDVSLENIFRKYRANELIEPKDLTKLSGSDILDSERFETLNKKEQRKLVLAIKDVDKNFFSSKTDDTPNADADADTTGIGSNVAYFICKFCKHYKPIQPGTLIYSKNYGADISATSVDTDDDLDYKLLVHDQSLTRIRNYICKNPECKTHADPNIREAVLTKNSSDQAVYICTICLTHWVNL